MCNIMDEKELLETLLEAVSATLNAPSPDTLKAMREAFNAYLLATAKINGTQVEFAARPAGNDLVKLMYQLYGIEQP